MALFVCEECGCVENTALASFWNRRHTTDPRALCSECRPDMTWHGCFPRRKYDPDTDHVQFKDGEWIAASDD